MFTLEYCPYMDVNIVMGSCDECMVKNCKGPEPEQTNKEWVI